MKRTAFFRLLAVLAIGAVVATSCGGSSDDEPESADTAEPTDTQAEDVGEELAPAEDEPVDEPEPEEEAEPGFEGELIGLFSLDPTSCAGDNVSGSYFQMIQPGGSLDDPANLVPNADSPCADSNFSALFPGTDGGLLTSSQQLAPDPPFDDAGNGLSSSIAEPVLFFGVDFALAIDGEAAPPSIVATNGALTGDMSAWSASYANLSFNQGAPKPDGSLPGLTSEVAGSIDPETGVYTLEWASQIVGGSFNDFTGVWHLEGTFTAAG